MPRSLLLCLLIPLCLPGPAGADAFDRYTNLVLTKSPQAAGVQEVKQLTGDLVGANDRILPGLTGALLVVKTNEGRYSKLLVQMARQRIAPGTFVPVLLIDRFVTYRAGEERAVHADGKH